MVIRVLLASPFRFYREGLERMLGEEPEVTLVGTAFSAAEAAEQVRTLAPDLALIDATMTHGSPAKYIATIAASCKVIALGVPEDEVLSCARIGITGFVTPGAPVNDLMTAIRVVARGEVHCPRKIAGSLVRSIATAYSERHVGTPLAALTAREVQILTLVQQGMSNKIIARSLGIELPTVKNHVHSVLAKLGIRSRVEAILVFYGRGGLDELAFGSPERTAARIAPAEVLPV
jgi:two-component system, NarL family, nitrate/nitrite response regulator NarL